MGGMAAALVLPPREYVMGSYVTSLEGRTRGQKMNAIRAAKAIDGTVIESGAAFSFNRTVGSWTPDRGYVLAPVSYGGELVVDWGGGVCQTSTTLYNAALIAGLEVVERHRHNWAPSYVAAGRDAAVAQYVIDLRLRNPYPWPVRIRAVITRTGLGFEILGQCPGPMATVYSKVLSAVQPSEVIKRDDGLRPGTRQVIVRGRPGMRVAVYRKFLNGARAGEVELVSQDTYPPVNRVVLVGREG